MDLYYPNDSKSDLIGYTYGCYLSYPHNIIMVYHKQDICSHVVTHDFMAVWIKP